MTSGLAGRTAIVTGAAAGIGAASVRHLIAAGAQVAAVDVDEPGLTALVGECGEAAVLAIQADLTHDGSIDRVIALACERFGVVDLLHNNAGVLGAVGPLWTTPAAEFDRVMAINCRAPYLLLGRFLAQLLGAGRPGAVVNTSSTAGMRGVAGLSAYCASKQAILGLTRAAAAEAGPHGVRVNAICPGRVETQMAGAFVAAADDRPAGDRVGVGDRPIARPAEAGEIAEIVTWLLSDAASFVTGAIYAIDGGQTAV